MTQPLCRKNKYGYCRYGETCRYRHINVICVAKSCNVFKCEKRHPKICNFFTDFGQCKFTTYCAYKHEKKKDAFENSEKIKELEKKILSLEKSASKKDDTVERGNIEKKMEALEKSLDEKIVTFENKLKDFKNIIEDKDLKITDLEKQLKDTQNKVTEFIKIEDKLKNGKKKKTFECDKCDFTAASDKGLRTHKARIHTISSISDVYPKTCELCDFEAKNKSELKKHLKMHSYKAVNLQCRECHYFCETELEMDVHIGKKHSDKFECGICEFEVTTLENLKTHLTTCERYKCEHCDKRYATLTDVKTHLETDRTELWNGLLEIFHLKQNRLDSETIDQKSHFIKDLFPDLVPSKKFTTQVN